MFLSALSNKTYKSIDSAPQASGASLLIPGEFGSQVLSATQLGVGSDGDTTFSLAGLATATDGSDDGAFSGSCLLTSYLAVITNLCISSSDSDRGCEWPGLHTRRGLVHCGRVMHFRERPGVM